MNQFEIIYVTGPQRSGTRIASKMIAKDINYNFIDEKYFNYENIKKLSQITEMNSVIHCPCLCHCIHKFSNNNNNNLIVIMKRNISDIINSQKRISWNEQYELTKYKNENLTISEIKYKNWELQKIKIKNFIEIEYESLKYHKLWISKEFRKNFSDSQTKIIKLI